MITRVSGESFYRGYVAALGGSSDRVVHPSFNMLCHLTLFEMLEFGWLLLLASAKGSKEGVDFLLIILEIWIMGQWEEIIR